MDQHVEMVHLKDKPFQCLIRKKSFGEKGYLNKHLQIVHEKEKPFTCLICKKSFGLSQVCFLTH